MKSIIQIPKKWAIVIITILIISVGLNIYQIIPSRIDTKGEQKRLQLQKEIDSLLFEYNKSQEIIDNNLIIIDSLQKIKKDPIIIIENRKNESDKKFKIYKSLDSDDRIDAWIKKSRQ